MPDISESLNIFLSNIQLDSDQIRALYQLHLKSWGTAIIPVGLAVIAQRLQGLFDSTFTQGRTGDETAVDNRIHASGIGWLGALQEAILQMGDPGYQRLLQTLEHPEGDIVALAGLELGTADLAKSQAFPAIQARYQRAKGHSVQIALALALFAQGNSEPLKARMVPFSRDPKHLEQFMSDTQEVVPHASRDDLERIGLQEFTVPAALRLVILDIASKGMFPRHFFPTWKRE